MVSLTGDSSNGLCEKFQREQINSLLTVARSGELTMSRDDAVRRRQDMVRSSPPKAALYSFSDTEPLYANLKRTRRSFDPRRFCDQLDVKTYFVDNTPYSSNYHSLLSRCRILRMKWTLMRLQLRIQSFSAPMVRQRERGLPPTCLSKQKITSHGESLFRLHALVSMNQNS